MTSFADLVTSKTLEKWKNTIFSIAILQGFDPENWSEGGFIRSAVALFSTLYAQAGDVVKLVAGAAFLDSCEGPWLTLLAKQVFGVDRIEATTAKAPAAITLTNTGGGVYEYAANDIVFAHSSTGKTYRNTSGGTLAAGGTLVVDVEAEEAGSDSNASVGAITEIVSGDVGVTCTNTIALVGLDEETDPQLRVRCRASIAALSIGGIKRAYEFFAKSAKRADGTAVGITRVYVVPPTGDGTLTVYLAGARGAVPPDDVAVVQAIFDLYVSPYGFNGTAASASNLSISAPCTVWIPASLGMSEDDVQTTVDAALEEHVNLLPVGGTKISPVSGRVYHRGLLGAIFSAVPGMIKAELDDETDEPVADNEVPVWGGLPAQVAVETVVGA